MAEVDLDGGEVLTPAVPSQQRGTRRDAARHNRRKGAGKGYVEPSAVGTRGGYSDARVVVEAVAIVSHRGILSQGVDVGNGNRGTKRYTAIQRGGQDNFGIGGYAVLVNVGPSDQTT